MEKEINLFIDNEELVGKEEKSVRDFHEDLETDFKMETNKKDSKQSSNLSYEERQIRIGREYQAVCPAMKTENERINLREHALKVWAPTGGISDTKLEQYLALSNEKFGYNIEQALAMLFWHKYDINKATNDLKNYGPYLDEWTPEEKLIFEKAIKYNGKNFHRIRELLPGKTVGGLVNYYYTWRKKGCPPTRGRKRVQRPMPDEY